MSSEDIIRVGDVVRINGSLRVDGVLTDPTTLVITITKPDLTQETYEWNIDPEVVRAGEGQFYYDLTVNAPGTWTWRWNSNANLTAFDEGSITTASGYTVQSSVDGTPTPFVKFKVYEDGQLICEGQTDTNGDASLDLNPGYYRFVSFKEGFIFNDVVIDLVTPGTPPDVELLGYALEEGWLKITDLETVVNVEDVDRLFHDDNSGIRDPKLLQSVMQQAEALAESKLLRSWSREQIARLAFHDDNLRMQAAWIALELATERRGEFIAADGKGRFWAQYERAINFFDSLSKSKDHSRGEKSKAKLGVQPAGQGANSGGNRKPRVKNPPGAWVYADESDGRKHGGF